MVGHRDHVGGFAIVRSLVHELGRHASCHVQHASDEGLGRRQTTGARGRLAARPGRLAPPVQFAAHLRGKRRLLVVGAAPGDQERYRLPGSSSGRRALADRRDRLPRGLGSGAGSRMAAPSRRGAPPRGRPRSPEKNSNCSPSGSAGTRSRPAAGTPPPRQPPWPDGSPCCAICPSGLGEDGGNAVRSRQDCRQHQRHRQHQRQPGWLPDGWPPRPRGRPLSGSQPHRASAGRVPRPVPCSPRRDRR